MWHTTQALSENEAHIITNTQYIFFSFPTFGLLPLSIGQLFNGFEDWLTIRVDTSVNPYNFWCCRGEPMCSPQNSLQSGFRFLKNRISFDNRRDKGT